MDAYASEGANRERHSYAPLMRDARARAHTDPSGALLEPHPEPMVQSLLDMPRTDHRSLGVNHYGTPKIGHSGSGLSMSSRTPGQESIFSRPAARRHSLSFESFDGSVSEFQISCSRRKKARRDTNFANGADLNFHLRDMCRAATQQCNGKSGAKLKEEMLEKAVSEGELQCDRLEELGFTAEDLCRVIYDEYINEYAPPDLVRHLNLETAGGLNRIESIWIENGEKYFWFVYLLLSVAFNLTFLLVMNWTIFQTYMAHLENGFLQELDNMNRLTLTNVTSDLELTGDNSSTSAVEHSMQLAIVFREIHSAELVRLLLNIAALIASWEVLWIIFKIMYSFHLWAVFLLDSSEFRAFRAINVFFLDLLPQFSTFSAIKFMARVHPSLLYNKYMYNIKESPWRGTLRGRIATHVLFVLENLICVAVGVMAFAIKMLAVGLRLIEPEYSWFFRICSVISLMVQCMGCVLMEKVLQERVHLFVFGGQDSEYEDDEHAYKTVYECRIAKQIWLVYWTCGVDFWSRCKAIVILATFDHYDLQKLLLQANDASLRFDQRMRLSPNSQVNFGVGGSPLSPVRERESLPEGEDGRPFSLDSERDEVAYRNGSAPGKEDVVQHQSADAPDFSPKSSCSGRSFGMRALARTLRPPENPSQAGEQGDDFEWGDSMRLTDVQPL